MSWSLCLREKNITVFAHAGLRDACSFRQLTAAMFMIACRLFVTLSTQHVHLNNKRKGKVLFHICMMQFLRMEVYGSKKKMIYIQGSYIIYMISLR